MHPLFKENHIIAAVRSESELQACLKDTCSVVFLLFGTLLSVPVYIEQLKSCGKTVFVHLDLIEGLAVGKSSVDYIKEKTQADGIISIKQAWLKYGKKLGFTTIQRVFMLDSRSIEGLEKISQDRDIDIVEIMPGIVITEIPDILKDIHKGIIGGGLIRNRESAERILASGADAVSTSNTLLLG